LDSLSHGSGLEERELEGRDGGRKGEKESGGRMVLPKPPCQDLPVSQPWVSGGRLQKAFLENSLPLVTLLGFLSTIREFSLRLAMPGMALSMW
jgi:hypothetical protein